MAEALKAQFGTAVPRRLAAAIEAVAPEFPAKGFLKTVLSGYEPLVLIQRGWKIADALAIHLPRDYGKSAAILLASLGPKLETTESFGMETFFYLPHIFYVARYGLEDFETSMQLQYELTQRFTAEFSIRAFIERYPQATLKRLECWTQDHSAHVRRLVSEGTRPRLPWASRLRAFQQDPSPVLRLLELLKDDPSLYVRRSVANNLNDIGKDNPELLFETIRRWQRNASEERRWLLRHALRSAVKRAEPQALALLGCGTRAQIEIDAISVLPKKAKRGEKVTIAFTLKSASLRVQRLLVDLKVYFVKASGRSSPKVFKLKSFELEPHATIELRKTISLADLTTRRHYPGLHRVALSINGQASELGSFELNM